MGEMNSFFLIKIYGAKRYWCSFENHMGGGLYVAKRIFKETMESAKSTTTPYLSKIKILIDFSVFQVIDILLIRALT